MGTQPALETLLASIPAPRARLRQAETAPAPQAAPSRLDVLGHFDQVFAEAPATEPEEIAEAFRLRYQVYCLDRGYESADSCLGGMEKDFYDEYALHSILREQTSEAVLGTVRLVLPPAGPTWFAGMPLADYAPLEAIEAIKRLPRGTTAEVSRFAITRSAREILKDSRSGSGYLSAIDESGTTVGEKLLPYMSLGLIRGLVRLSMLHGVTHWCLAAEPSLLRRLRSYGLHFQNAGPLVEHRGLRQVCYAELE
ncbi:MAG: PEP-CTERM/exosortase system-associated acyltransferase [Kiloniellaceae bacterium]